MKVHGCGWHRREGYAHLRRNESSIRSRGSRSAGREVLVHFCLCESSQFLKANEKALTIPHLKDTAEIHVLFIYKKNSL